MTRDLPAAVLPTAALVESVRELLWLRGVIILLPLNTHVVINFDYTVGSSRVEIK